jgi:hypothetical protein
MAPHDLFLAWIEAAGLVENRQGNTGFADVMKGCPCSLRYPEGSLSNDSGAIRAAGTPIRISRRLFEI